MLETDSYDAVCEIIEDDDRVLEIGVTDGVRGAILFVEADTKETVIDVLADEYGREDAEMAVYTVGSDADGTYRIGLPVEAA